MTRSASCTTLLSLALLGSSTAQAQIFRADYTAAQEVPPNGSTATGLGIFTLDAANMLHYYVRHTVSNETVKRINGPAPPGVNAGVQFALLVGTPVSGTLGPLTAAQVADLNAGLWYSNIHSSAFPGGEIRGQLNKVPTPATFAAEYSGSHEVPANASTASGLGTFTLDSASVLYFTVRWSGLTGSETAAHIHGPAPPGVNAGVQFSLPLGTPVGGVAGTLTAAQVADLLSELWYSNLHSTAFPGGEIRGQIVSSRLGVEGNGGPARGVALEVRPNPAYGIATLAFATPKEGRVRLAIYDLRGRLTRVLQDGWAPPGTHRVSWDQKNVRGERVESGVYFARLTGPGLNTVQRVVVVR